MSEVRKADVVPYLRPDGKSQVTVQYEGGKPKFITAVVLSTQHKDGIDIDSLLRPDLIEHVIHPMLPEGLYDPEFKKTKLYVNPTGKFVIGGPMGDTGLTGRKIIVDTYGGFGRHGGGAFSGKDPSKVDRSGAYAARYVAKNIVAAGLAERCEVQVAYAIGVAHPVSVMVECFGTAHVDPATYAWRWWPNTSTCGRPPSSATCGCSGPSTRRLPPTVTSAVKMPTSLGRAPTGQMHSERPRGSNYSPASPGCPGRVGGRSTWREPRGWLTVGSHR